MSEIYDLVIGLEVHIQLLTESKMFCADSAAYGGAPNAHVSAISLAHPGTLPKTNKKAVEFAIKMGLACGCTINRFHFFDRKNYFYPDLPKGYQISQDKAPICMGGAIKIRPKGLPERYIQLNRIHMEEDAGKLIHVAGEPYSLVDLNRAGVPLLELVTEPDIHSADEAYAFLSEIKKRVEYLGICDGNMEEGSLRCDANISVKPRGSDVLGRKVEIKNMNSFRNVHRAIGYEWARQTQLLDAGKEIASETRMYDAERNETYSMRSKETLNDYRYFPEPDLQPIVVTDAWLATLQETMPELPEAFFERFMNQFHLPEYDAAFLSEHKEVAVFFEAVCAHCRHFKAVSNWMMGPVQSYRNAEGKTNSQFPLLPQKLAEIIDMVENGKISHSVAVQQLFPAMMQNPHENPEHVAARLNLLQDSDEGGLEAVVHAVLAAMPDKVAEYRKGRKALLGLFMGEVKKATQGKADPRLASKLLEKALG